MVEACVGRYSALSCSVPCVINALVDDVTLRQLLRINDELLKLSRWLTDKGDREISSKLMLLVDELNHILIEEGKKRLH
jgi:hypothetical protein